MCCCPDEDSKPQHIYKKPDAHDVNLEGKRTIPKGVRLTSEQEFEEAKIGAEIVVEEKRRFAHLFILDRMPRCQRSKQKPHHYEPNYGHGK